MKDNNCIEISNKLLKSMTIQSKTDNAIKLSSEDVNFIETLTKQEFKTNKNFLPDNEMIKLNELCLRFSVSSFEEIIRKILFYKLIKLKLSDKYITHIKIFSKIRIAKSLIIRRLLLETAYNMPEVFYNFCQRWEYINEFEDIKIELSEFISKIKDNKNIQNTFIEMSIILEEIDRYFGAIFNSVFYTEDYAKIYAHKMSFLLKEHVASYLYLISNVLFDTLPNNTRRDETSQETNLLLFLLYEGDEIDYMHKYKLSVTNFNDLMARIIYNHRENKQQEMINAFYIAKKIEN